MWQAEADTELALSATPATAVGQIQLTLAKFCFIRYGVSKIDNLIGLDGHLEILMWGLKEISTKKVAGNFYTIFHIIFFFECLNFQMSSITDCGVILKVPEGYIKMHNLTEVYLI